MRDLSGMHALVTGGSRGLGPYVARALSREGARLTLTARTAGELREVAEALAANPIVSDLTDDDARSELLKRAVAEQGRSLLAIGIVEVDGRFEKGDVVALLDTAGNELARGLTNYTSDEVARIRGLRSSEIAAALSHCPYEEVIHRDNMALTGA